MLIDLIEQGTHPRAESHLRGLEEGGLPLLEPAGPEWSRTVIPSSDQPCEAATWSTSSRFSDRAT